MIKNLFNSDFQDFVAALNLESVDYVLIGGYSVILHGYSRTTGDLDIFVRRTAENYERLVRAFHRFGMPVFDMNLEKYMNLEGDEVFTFGRPPVSIDILTKAKGLDFEAVFSKSEWFQVEENLRVRALRLADLLEAKRAAARPKDLDDLENLEKKNRV